MATPPDETTLEPTIEENAPTTGNQLDSFYDKLQTLTSTDSKEAVDQCRLLCAQYGFTIKQEAASRRQYIYLYCSREGIADSQRKNNTRPLKRHRISKRCGCKWRIVLHEIDGHWAFRPSTHLPVHNHDLMRPDQIDCPWPKQAIELIWDLAKQHVATADVRSRLRAQFSDLHWNERRFYNRVMEARHKVKQMETQQRACQLTDMWTRLCMATAGHEPLARFVEDGLGQMLQAVCDSLSLDRDALVLPFSLTDSSQSPLFSTAPPHGMDMAPTTTDHTITPDQDQFVHSEQVSVHSRTSKPPEPPKGYTTIDIPQHSYVTKVYTDRFKTSIIPVLSVSTICDPPAPPINSAEQTIRPPSLSPTQAVPTTRSTTGDTIQRSDPSPPSTQDASTPRTTIDDTIQQSDPSPPSTQPPSLSPTQAVPTPSIMTDDTIQHSDPNSSPTQTASTTRIADDTRQHSDPSPSSTQVASIPKTTTTDDTIQQPDPSPLSPPPTSTDNIAPPSESIPSPTTQPMERPPAQPSLDTQFVAEPSVQHLFNDSRLNTIPKQEHYRSSSTWTHLPYEPTFVYYTNYYYPPPQYTTANFNSPPNGI